MATSLDAALEALERYTRSWTQPVTTPNDFPLPRQKETVPSGRAFTHYIPHSYQQPFLYRLAFLKQLSTVAVTTHLDATHTRLTHAIGTAKVAARMLEVVQSSETLDGETLPRDDLLERACIFYCFIHDAFHGPLGHSLDLMKDVFEISLAHKLDVGSLSAALRAIIDDSLNLGGPEGQLLAAAEACAPGRGIELLRYVKLLSDPAALRRTKPQFVFLRDIVDSQLDADRIDYLRRDGPVLDGWSGEQLPSVIEGARVGSITEDGVRLRRLAFSSEHEGAIADALRIRRKLYAEHYETAQKLIVDDMVCHGVFYVLRDIGVLTAQYGDREQQLRSRILRNVLLLTDDDLVPALRDLAAPAGAYALFHRVRQHNYFVAVYEVGIPYSRVDELVRKHKSWQEAITQFANRLVTERRGRKYSEVSEPNDLRLIVEASKSYLDDNELLAFAYQHFMYGAFRAKVDVEARIWAALMALPKGDEHFDRFLSTEHGRGAIDEPNRSTHKTHYTSYPPIHLTSPSFVRVETSNDVEQYQKEGPQSGVLLYSRRPGSSTYSLSNTPIRLEIARSYVGHPLVLSAPVTLVEAFGADTIRARFAAELKELRWLYSTL